MTYFNKELISYTHKGLKSNKSIGKWTKDIKGQYTEDKIQMENNTEDTCPYKS